MLDRVLKSIKEHSLINCGDTVLVGLSGGPDSVCLLHVLKALSTELGFKMQAIHINHNLRGLESDGDEAYSREFCEKLGIVLHVRSFDIHELSRLNKMSLEETGREVRYREFEMLAQEISAKSIAVAHNKNDQAETILLNMLRGTGLKGLCGIEYIQGRIIRPILDISRDEIEEYCIKHKLNPHIDSSNLKADYSRNKIRLDLIPHIKDIFNIDATESLYRMSLILKSDNDYLEAAAVKAFDNCVRHVEDKMIKLQIDAFVALHPAISSRVIRLCIKKVKGDIKGIESKHVEEITELALKGRTGSSIQLPKGIRAGISYTLLEIYSDKTRRASVYFDKQLNIPGFTVVEEIKVSIAVVLETKVLKVDKYFDMGYNSLVQFFDYDKLYKGINIRNRREGDVFAPIGAGGTKKLKEYFIDRKIPRDAREKIPLIAFDKQIVWVIGYRISDKFKVTDNTKRVIKIEVMENRD